MLPLLFCFRKLATKKTISNVKEKYKMANIILLLLGKYPMCRKQKG